MTPLTYSTTIDHAPRAMSFASEYDDSDHSFVVEEIEALLPNMRRYARALTRNPDEADDVVQDALVSALGNQHQFRPGTNLRAWLFTIIRNAFHDRIRRNRKQVAMPLDESEQPSTDANQEDHVRCGEVARAFRRLPSHSREVISLVVFEGMSYEQAAAVLGVRLGTVRSRLSRARSMLDASLS